MEWPAARISRSSSIIYESKMRKATGRRLFLLILAILPLAAQTTQGLIEGSVVDSLTGNAIPRARVVAFSRDTNTSQAAGTDSSGNYALPLLSPGTYQVGAEADGYQALQVEELVLPVGAVLSVPFRLRQLSNVWEQKQYQSVFLSGDSVLPLYGPDVDTSRSGNFDPPQAATGRLDTSLSDVISPQLIQELPLQGRDVYTALVMEPGVASDSATARGIGVAVNGQRPASTNFLLDGSENNNSLISGPLLTLPPEAIQEFRISTANFSAEYGRTAGSVVNAVTHAGGEGLHGIGYLDADRAGFNANSFGRNADGEGRLPFYQTTMGFNTGGPVPGRKRWLFWDTALDLMRSKGDDDAELRAFPSVSFVAQMAAHNPNGYGVQLLERFPPPAGQTTPDGMYSVAAVTPTTTVHRLLGLERFDIAPGSRNRISVRLAGGWTSEPDFNWSPYKGFSTALDDRTAGFSANLQTAASPNLTNELRVAWTYDNLAFPRPHPEIPNLITLDQPQLQSGQTIGGGVWLPQAGTLYGYQNRPRVVEVAENVTRLHGPHLFKLGGNLLSRSLGGYLGLLRDGQLTFNDLTAFFRDDPSTVELGIDRLAFQDLQYRPVDFNRDYSNRQLALFFEDSVRASRRLSVNFGIRYDNFGVPVNVGGTKDALVELGIGPDMPSRIQGAQLTPGAGRERLFAADNHNFAGRFGFSYLPGRADKTVIRAGYGIFYDRSFDNLWENLALNNVVLDPGTVSGAAFSYSRPLLENLAFTTPGGSTFNRLFMYQAGLRTPYVQSFFLGLQREIARGVMLESNYVGALGRELITTDRINRQFSVPGGNGNFNSNLPEIFYRGNQGDSNYNAFTVKLSGSGRTSTFRLAYTWSHSIDNQSDPLAGEYDDLSFTNLSAGSGYGISAFAKQFASGLDRGNSDFDQRHNLVAMGFWQLPRPLRGWRISGLAAIRSGLPFTVYASEGRPLYNARADLVDPQDWRADQPVRGGKRLLNATAFQVPADGILGNTGRNAFPGPGFFSVDASLSRSIHFKRLPERDHLILRADLFNILNHVNLNNPLPVALQTLGPNQNFGVALYGRSSITDGSPVLTPLEETTRQIHLIVRFEF